MLTTYRIAVSPNEESYPFCKSIGDPPWTKEERLADILRRWYNQNELGKLLEEWTIQHDHYEVMNTSERAGVAAGAVLQAAKDIVHTYFEEGGYHGMATRGRGN